MPDAHVVTSGLVEHPNSGKQVRMIEVDHPWASAGTSYPSTVIYGPAYMEAPSTGDPISWDGHHITYMGSTFPKQAYDASGAPTPLWSA